MGVIDDVKEVGDLIKKYNDIELNRKIVNLEGEVLDLTRDKRRLESRVEELTAVVDMKQKLVHRPPFYWLDGDPTPYCSSCWESQKKAIHVIFQFDNDLCTRWDCPTCKHEYILKKENAPQPSAARRRPFSSRNPRTGY